MYMPIDPHSLDGMWDKLKTSLVSQKSCLVISNGFYKSDIAEKYFSEEDACEVLAQIKSRKYSRIGSSRMNPVPAHFAIDISGNIGHLKEYISLSSEEERLSRDISLICQFSFFENKSMKELIIPFIIAGIEEPDLIVESNAESNTTRVYRR